MGLEIIILLIILLLFYFFKEHIFKYHRAPPQLLLLSMGGCCGNTKMNTLHKLHNRAARIVTGSPFDSSAVPLLQRLGWLSVDRLVHRETSTMVYKSLQQYKSLNGLAPDNLCQIFSRLSDVHNRLLRNTKCDLAIPRIIIIIIIIILSFPVRPLRGLG